MTIELAKGVYWVGFVDWTLRHFHGHELSTHRGSSYNSYLIVDEKAVLVDAVWGPYADRLLDSIREIIDPSIIDIVVANHAETDHAGALPKVMEAAQNATLIVSKRGKDSVEGNYHNTWNLRTVQTGERLSIGKRELVFIEAPMLHWPDSMFCYLTGDSILFSNDAFGQHYATSGRFNDEVDQQELYEEALDYFLWGTQCWIGGAANCAPRQHVDILKAALAGDFTTARMNMDKFLPLIHNMESGSYTQKVKVGCELLGIPVGKPRRPLLPLLDEDRREFERVFALAQ